ncbi:MAG: thymidine phosphorylase [Clostridia bacterium]|nr:thymidine phosphorylase [Clostridia bacterium]MBQ4341837.1 thymidine phosphorylase [Clostridia bacterium]
MIVTELIEMKRDGAEASAEQIRFMVNGFVSGEVSDAQMAAWMMAICIRGMTPRETGELTLAMMHSGDVVDLSDLPGVKVDKHSTGGVGDTTTLVAAPLVAACGGTVAKMSGRGLAHSGGTLDKLESVPGVCVEQPLDRFKRIVRDLGVCVIGQSGDLVPADKKMYALRDVTGTVQSIPLIASSIMSKKLASGADAIVLDVKTGGGAFMKTVEDSAALAREMVRIGDSLGRRTAAVITDMNRPLGMAIGNGLEMKEAVDVLSGRVPESDPLVRVCLTLGGHMLRLSGLAKTREEAERKLLHALRTGEGLRRLRAMLGRLGGDVSYVDEPERLVRAAELVPVASRASGFVSAIDAKKLGVAAALLGAGRFKKDDVIDPAVGILMKKRYGDRVEAGEPFAVMYVNSRERFAEAYEMISSAVTVSQEPPKEIPLVYEVIE